MTKDRQVIVLAVLEGILPVDAITENELNELVNIGNNTSSSLFKRERVKAIFTSSISYKYLVNLNAIL